MLARLRERGLWLAGSRRLNDFEVWRALGRRASSPFLDVRLLCIVDGFLGHESVVTVDIISIWSAPSNAATLDGCSPGAIQPC